MMLEVELKFPLADEAALRERLQTVAAVEGEPIQQADTYYNHPSRDFARTDEALRVRSVDGDAWVTYKGPRVSDGSEGTAAKTRFELELPLAAETAEGWAEMLGRLGFREVATVRKVRTPFQLERGGRRLELTIDQVEGVGTFAEVESVAEEKDKQGAETAVIELARELGLDNPEPRSYLEMLLTAGSQPSAEAD